MFYRKDRSILLLLVLLVVSAGSTFAQKTWEKPYEKWSREDALKIVSDSPWAVTYLSRESVAVASQIQTARDQMDSANSGGGGRGAGSGSRFGAIPPVVVRLHSGIPIRRAIARARQLAAGYDKMDAEKKKEFDTTTKGFLDCAICTKYYVVSITKVPDSSTGSVQEAIFQRSTLEDLKNNVWLVNEAGEQRALTQFTPPKHPGDSAYFFFARNEPSAKPFIAAGDKTFKLVFNNNFFADTNPYAGYVPRSFAFNVSKIVVNDELWF